MHLLDWIAEGGGGLTDIRWSGNIFFLCKSHSKYRLAVSNVEAEDQDGLTAKKLDGLMIHIWCCIFQPVFVFPIVLYLDVWFKGGALSGAVFVFALCI